MTVGALATRISAAGIPKADCTAPFGWVSSQYEGRKVATPEQQARDEIDRLLGAAGWAVQDFRAADIHAARGVALREFPLKDGHGAADYLLYVGGKAAGVIEAKRQDAS